MAEAGGAPGFAQVALKQGMLTVEQIGQAQTGVRTSARSA